MIISCPECETSFNIPNNALGENGRKVKCSKCSHVWHQDPIEIKKEKLDSLLGSGEGRASANSNVGKANDAANLPVKVNKGYFYGLVASFLVLVALSALFVMFNQAKNSQSISNILAINNFDGLRFVDFEVQSEIVDNKYDFFITGKFYNDSEDVKNLPPVTVKVLSQGGNLLQEAIISPEADMIEPNSYVDFNPEISQITGNASALELSFASWTERLFE